MPLKISHAMSIYPEYFKVDGKWLLAEESRMDYVAVLENNKIFIKEFRNLKKGELVAVGRTEDGSDGIYLHTEAFKQAEEDDQAFAFRQNRSRETAFSKDYDDMYELLEYEKENGKILGLYFACAFDHDTRDAISSLIKNGYMHGFWRAML